MTLFTIILLAVALAMDALAVSVASGMAIKDLRIKHSLIIATWFGFFQAIMPLLGWFGGVKLHRFISEVDHWIVFGLLFFIGSKMIYEAFQAEPVKEKSNPMDVGVLFALSIATSLDAFAAGVSLALLDVAIVTPVIIIGVITFIMSFTGTWIGNRGIRFFEKKIEAVAGVVLISIGIKVLFEHLLAG